jgi:MFS transporter, UMF1 family
MSNEPKAPEAASGERRGMMAWALYDWASNAFNTVIQTFVFAAYFTQQVAAEPGPATSQWGYTLGSAGLVVALSGPLLGSIIDQRGPRKPLMGVFTAICVVATALLWFVEPSAEHVWLALLLVWVATIGFEYASILYNSMLPALVDWDRLGRWSGWGWTMGYAGGLLCLTSALGLFVFGDAWLLPLDAEAAEDVRATFVFAALWFLVFSLPFFLITPDAPKSTKSWRQAASDGWSSLADTVRNVRHYAGLVRFLVARIFYTDGLATLFAFGGVDAAGAFGMGTAEVLLFGIALNVAAGIGAFGFSWVDDWIGSRRTILFSLVNLIVWGSLILLVTEETLFWLFGMLLGVFVGPVQAASRAYLARAAPEPLRVQMFGLYALSGKATAFVGPLLVGLVTSLTDSQRVGMTVILGYFTIGLLLMLTVPEAKNQKGDSR